MTLALYHNFTNITIDKHMKHILFVVTLFLGVTACRCDSDKNKAIALSKELESISTRWYSTFIPADELIGQKATIAYYFVDLKGNACGYWGIEKNIVQIVNGEGNFIHGIHHDFIVRVGFYNGTELVKSKDVLFYTNEGDASTAKCSPNDMAGCEIIEHLNNTGSVRFVASTYGGRRFDIMVPIRTEKNTVPQ